MAKNPTLPTFVPVAWEEFNDKIRNCSEEVARTYVDLECKGSRRKMFVLRAHSRLNKLRADRERKELLKLIGG